MCVFAPVRVFAPEIHLHVAGIQPINNNSIAHNTGRSLPLSGATEQIHALFTSHRREAHAVESFEP